MKFNEKEYFEALRKLNNVIKYKEAEYFNMCFATAIANGIKLTEDKINKCLLNGVSDKMISYEQSMTLRSMYLKVLICE